MSNTFTHFDKDGRVNMVDIGQKPVSQRKACAQGNVIMEQATLDVIKSGNNKKGDVMTIAEIAGIMAAKRTADLIPLCHPLPLSSAKITIDIDDALPGLLVTAKVETTAQTGIEMEALTAVSITCLTIYDMVKAVDKSMRITNIEVVEKSGGRSGVYTKTTAKTTTKTIAKTTPED